MGKRILKWIGGIVIGLMVLVFLGLIWLWIGFQGGIDGLIRNAIPDVNPQDKLVIQKRNESISEVHKSFIEIEGLLPFKEYAISTDDRCHRGDNNWKRSDGYSNHCGYRITKFYGLNGDFKQSMLNFEKGLFAHGWVKPDYALNNPMESLMQKYDQKYGTKLLYGEGWYDVSHLPSSIASYTKDGQSFRIEFAENTTSNLDDIEFTQYERSGIAAATETYEVKNFQNVSELLNKITKDNRYLIVISIQKAYFEK